MLINFTNDFTFLTKKKIEFGKKNKTISNVPEPNTDTPTLDKNTTKEGENKTRPVIQEAPISITQKTKIRKYRKRRKKFNLPKSISLAGISEFDELKDEDDKTNENNLDDEIEEYEEQEEIEEQDQPMEIIDEDEDMPLDYYRNKNKFDHHKSIKSSSNLTFNERRANNNNNENNNNNNNKVTSTVTGSSAVPPPPPPQNVPDKY